MKRRCVFLDNLPDFNFNNGIGVDEHRMRTDTRKLGSTLMKTMLQEVADFCDPTIKNSWSEKPHQQVSIFLSIYLYCTGSHIYMH